MIRRTEDAAVDTLYGRDGLIPRLTKLTFDQPTTAELEEALNLLAPLSRCLRDWISSRHIVEGHPVMIGPKAEAIAAALNGHTGNDAMRAEAEVLASDLCSPEEDAAFEQLAKETAQIREAQKIDAAHPGVFNMADFAADVCGMKKVV